ncbi:MAG: glycosyl hydrolase family 28 protein [Ginsengibacter sp.]
MTVLKVDIKIKNLKKLSLLLFLLFAFATGYCQQKEFSIISYGAKPDGVTNNVSAIQGAIDDVNKNGGGRVTVPRGRFLSAPIHLKSNVQLFIHEEAVLLASTDRADYGPSLQASAFIIADNEKNISITGKGLIDGQCDLLVSDIYKKLRSGELYDDEWKEFNAWHQRRPSERNRPRIIEFKNCDGVTVKNIHLQNGAAWIQNYKNCSNMIIDSIHVFSNTFWNNDGIDIVDCKNVKITNCNINAADDGICLKSEDSNNRCENIYVANCRIRSSASAVKLGTTSYGGFKKIVIKNIEVYDTYRSAIAIEAVDGGVAEDIDVRNIHAVNTGNAIFIRLGHRNKDSVYSSLHDVYIADITVQVPKDKPDKGYPMEGPALKYPSTFKADTSAQYQSVSPWNNSGIDSSAVPYPHNVFPSSVTGLPGHVVENVTLENIEITYAGGASKEVNYFPLDSFRVITEATKDYPEFSMFGEVPAWGFYARHVKGLTLKNILLTNSQDDYRAGILINDATKVELKKIEVQGATSMPVVFINNTHPLQLEQIEIPGKREDIISIKELP